MLEQLYKLTQIIVLYIIILAIYFKIKNTYIRTILTSLLFLVSVIFFRINYKFALLYLFLGTCAVFTEYIFMKFIVDSWDYRKVDICLIPYWLIPLWSMGIIIIINLYEIVKSIKM